MGVEAPGPQLIPVTLDEQIATLVAPGALPPTVVDIAGVGVTHAIAAGDLAGPAQGGGGGR